MRLVCLLVLVCLVLASAASARMCYETLYPGEEGTPGENWIALRGVPYNSDPATIFGDYNRIDWGRLIRLDAPTNSQLGYLFFDPATFGGMLLGEGYSVLVDDGAGYTVEYEAAADALSVDNGLTGTDMWISLPGNPDNGEHWVGFPFDHNVEMTACMVTDGTQTISVQQAIQDGWIENYWTTMDNTIVSQEIVDVDGFLGGTTLMPGRMYVIKTLRPDLALIIPAGTNF